MTVRAYSYIRMSRPEQLRGDSLRRQLEAAQEWAAQRGLELDDSLRDIGVSAFRGKNRDEGALRGFLDLVEAGQVERGSYLIIESLDRLSREAVLEALPRFLDLIRAGIVIVTLADRQEYSSERLTTDWTPLILSLAVMARAHEESKIKGERVGKAWAEKRRKAAEKPLTKIVPEWLQLQGNRIQALPDRAEVIRRIYQLTADGHGKRSVAAKLNGEHVPAFRSANGWHPSYVQKVLDNRAVLGEFQPCRLVNGRRVPDGEPVQGYFPPVVTEELYWRAQAARKRRKAVPGRRGAEFTNLLQGLARCRECGARMTLLNKGPGSKGGRYFQCSAAARKAGCSNTRLWRYDQVEAATLERVTQLDAGAVIEGDMEEEDTAAHLRDLRAALDDAKARRERWAKLIDGGDELAEERYRAAQAEIRRLKRTLAAAEKEAAENKADGTMTGRLDAVRRLREVLASADPGQRRDVRARLAEALRRLLVQVDFSQSGVVGRYRALTGLASRMVPPPHLPVIVPSPMDKEMLEAEIIASEHSLEMEEQAERDAEWHGKGIAQLLRWKAARSSMAT